MSKSGRSASTVLGRAIQNLRTEETGDWYRDPWRWPEYDYILKGGDRIIRNRARSHGRPHSVAEIDVPKENFGLRPAMVLDLVDRVVYQLMVDRVSVDIVGDMSANAFGWRLPPEPRGPGAYARQSFQWDGYRGELSHFAGIFSAGLKTDIASCFASIPVEGVVEQLIDRSGDAVAIDKIARMLHGWETTTSRKGLPQRSTASAVLANMYLSNIDEVLAQYSRNTVSPHARRLRRTRSFCRWMDDMWIFNDDMSTLRKGQVALQSELLNLRLTLNTSKTKLLEGDDLVEAARKIQHSAVDGSLLINKTEPLERVIDDILDSVEYADRTTVKFAVKRMRDHGVTYRASDMIAVAHRMPHAADSLSRLFREFLPSPDIQDWILGFVSGGWNTFEWALAQFGTSVPSRRRPRKKIRNLFANALGGAAEGLPLVALASQRMAVWDPSGAREIIAARMAFEESPQIVRVLSLAALRAGEPPRRVRRWLAAHESNAITLEMLEQFGFAAPPTARDYN